MNQFKLKDFSAQHTFALAFVSFAVGMYMEVVGTIWRYVIAIVYVLALFLIMVKKREKT